MPSTRVSSRGCIRHLSDQRDGMTLVDVCMVLPEMRAINQCLLFKLKQSKEDCNSAVGVAWHCCTVLDVPLETRICRMASVSSWVFCFVQLGLGNDHRF
jgi:hypothetical protein